MYQKTLLGAVLNISCLLKTPGVVENHGYFLNPSRSSPQEIKVQESNIHQVGEAGLFRFLRCLMVSRCLRVQDMVSGLEFHHWFRNSLACN